LPTQESIPKPNSHRIIRLVLVPQDGTAIAYTAIRAKDGGVVEQIGGIYFPSVGKRGAFVMEFQRPAAIGTFCPYVSIGIPGTGLYYIKHFRSSPIRSVSSTRKFPWWR